MVGFTIIACEIGFWIILGAGLLTRYVFRQQRLGLALLACTPLVDVVLLVVSIVDLSRGGDPQWTHGLSALYLGYSILFGHDMIRWADQRVAHRFAGGPPPYKVPKHGPVRQRHEWKLFGKAAAASLIAAGISGILIAVTDAGKRDDAVTVTLPRIGIVLVIWFLTGPIWELFSTGSSKKPAES